MTIATQHSMDQALALAGVTQFALYAHELAQDGRQVRQRLDSALHAILCTEPDKTADVFAGVDGCADGIGFVRQQLDGSVKQTPAQVAHYTGQLLRLGTRLRKQPQALTRIQGAIERARLAQANEAPHIIAAAYRETISPMRPQIMVTGHPSYLQNPVFAEHVRTYLMAAIRCAVLWRQSGGAFWKTIFQRKTMVTALAQLADAAGKQPPMRGD